MKRIFINALLLKLLFLWTLPSNAQSWEQTQKIAASDRELYAQFGFSVSMNDQYAVVGAYRKTEYDKEGNKYLNAGAVYFFKKVDGNWTEVQKVVASNRTSGDIFGAAVSLSEDYLIVGSPAKNMEMGETSKSVGAAYIFKNEGGNWIETQKIMASDGIEKDYFGYSVSISKEYAMVGAWGKEGNTGAVYVFKNEGGNWTETQKLLASDRVEGDIFGESISFSEDYIAVGARNEDDFSYAEGDYTGPGAVYIFRNEGDIWVESQKLTASDRGLDDWFGVSVCISDNYLMVGAERKDENVAGQNSIRDAGAVYIFKNERGIWTETQKIVASERGKFYNFGNMIDISGDFAVIGAVNEDEKISRKKVKDAVGAAYIFENQNGIWVEVEKVVTPLRTAIDHFGYAVGISGDYAIVTAKEEDTYDGISIQDAGVVHIFKNKFPKENIVQIVEFKDLSTPDEE